VIDIHCHVLPGLDDGARTLEESLAILQVGAGVVTEIVATPHVRGDPGENVHELVHRVREVNEAAAAIASAPRVRTGGEVSCSHLTALSDDELAQVSLGAADRSGTRWVLLEAPYFPMFGGMQPFVEILRARGFGCVLAHPERSPGTSDPEEVRPLVENGAVVQVTASSLTGDFGDVVQRSALQLFRAGLVHVVASDAHRTGRRLTAFVELERRLREVDPALAEHVERLTVESPRRLLAGETEIPAATPEARRRSFRLRDAFRAGRTR
jgi:protein-tyrosine phosphatase